MDSADEEHVDKPIFTARVVCGGGIGHRRQPMIGSADPLGAPGAPDATRTNGQRSYGPGICCWTELRAADVGRAVSFYSELFGWTTRSVPVAPSESYTVLEAAGVAVAGVSPPSHESLTRAPDEPARAHWRLYTAIAPRAPPAATRPDGAAAPREPKLVRAGRWAAPGKPLGAIFAAARADQVLGDDAEPGAPAVIWMDLQDDVLAESAAFCRAFFEGAGESLEQPGPLLLANEEPGAASATGLTVLAGTASALPAWSAGFAVRDLDDTLRRALSLGARVASPPETFERLGRASGIVDPQGATFLCWQPQARTIAASVANVGRGAPTRAAAAS